MLRTPTGVRAGSRSLQHCVSDSTSEAFQNAPFNAPPPAPGRTDLRLLPYSTRRSRAVVGLPLRCPNRPPKPLCTCTPGRRESRALAPASAPRSQAAPQPSPAPAPTPTHHAVASCAKPRVPRQPRGVAPRLRDARRGVRLRHAIIPSARALISPRAMCVGSQRCEKDFDLVAEPDAEDGKRVYARRLLSLSIIVAPCRGRRGPGCASLATLLCFSLVGRGEGERAVQQML